MTKLGSRLVRKGLGKLTSRFDFVPHFSGFAFLDLGGGGVEAADLVVFFVGEDGGGEGLVFGVRHLIFGN